jgi:hypothetical protein
MAITNAQQYQQLVNKPADGKRPGYRGDAAYRSNSNQSSKSSGGQGKVGSKASFGGGKGRDTSGKSEGADGINTSKTKKTNKAKLKERKDFIDKKANYNKFTPGYLKFLGNLNREPNRNFFMDRFMEGPNAGKLVKDVLGLDEDGLSFSPSNLTEEQYEKVYQEQMKNRLSGETDAMGNPMPFTGGGIDAKSAGAERGDLTTLPLVQDKIIEEEDPIAYRFMADGGRAAFQEGGGIFPRLNELGSNVSSAEQELAALSQKINSAESTLGEGGGDEGGLGSIMPENNFTNPTLEAFSGTNIINNTMAPREPDQPESGPLQAGSGDLYGSLNKGLSDARQPPKGFTPGTPMQFANSAPSTNLPGSGAPQAGDVVYDPTGMPNIFAPRNGYADGGMSEYEGGIMDLESGRQQYFLGKLVKKAKKTIGKIYKSPLGKAALLGLGGKALFGKMGGFGGLKGSLFGTAGGTAAMTPGLLGKLGLTGGGGSMGLTGLGKIASLAGVSGLAGLMSKDGEEEYQDTYTGADFDLEGARKFPYKAMGGAYRFYANGGRTGYSSGSEDLSKSDVYQKWVQRYKANPDSPLVTMHEKADVFKNFYERSKNAKAEGGEPVAKETMPLLDIGGKEMDLRAEGGFVPIGRMEKADDVPARLSKNEFVFTADAVRNAGNGNVDKGAEVMYKTMKNLEAGGKMSKKSQGLEGIL